MKRFITLTTGTDAATTRKMLEALARCERIGQHEIIANVKPEVEALFADWQSCPIQLQKAGKQTLSSRTHTVLNEARRATPAIVIHLDDNMIPERDALAFFDFAVNGILVPDVGHTILLASGWNEPAATVPESNYTAIGFRQIFTPFGWAVDYNRLLWILTQWCFRDANNYTDKFRKGYRTTRREVFPIVSRINNPNYDNT